MIEPGDTWRAISIRYRVPVSELKAFNPHPNIFREPAIGKSITIPNVADYQRTGSLIAGDQSIFQISAETGIPAYQLALINQMPHPSSPKPEVSLYVPGDQIIKDLPVGFSDLVFSHNLARAGEGMALKGRINQPIISGKTQIGDQSGSLFAPTGSPNAVGLLATGAFFWEGAPHVDIVTQTPSQKPSCKLEQNENCTLTHLWTQPWLFEGKQWTFNNITLTGAAAEIDAEAIAAERARLFEIWQQPPAPNYFPTGSFNDPVKNFLYKSSFYGARRSYNGGPYSSYHEGLDFAAYRGTDVNAAAEGKVVVAEMLYVRGGSVVIDHGWGIFTGAYHLETVDIEVGASVIPDQKVGTLGSTGLSTGPHLHWDLLVNGVWVDPLAWQIKGMNCWILAAMERTCS
ncbi:MAG: M23 family metallopeptidase [Chloroflexota bacterium]